MDTLQRARTTLIRYPRFNQLHESIQECLELSRDAGEPHCMSMEGVTGAGKTTLIKSYVSAFPRREMEEGSRIPIFYMQTPSPVTVKGMAAAMLEALGDPAAHKGTIWAMNSRLVHFLKKCQVEFVILDDFQHLVDADTNRILRKVSDWLKTLIKQTNVPFLVVGIDGEVERILIANAQLSRLFAAREKLEPFMWDADTLQTVQDFSRFVAYAERGIGLPLTKELPRAALLYRIHLATDGVVGNVMNLLRRSAYQAHKEGMTTLTLPILSASYERRLMKHVGKSNPFVSTQRQFKPPVISDPPESTGNKSRRHKEKQIPVREVLRAS